MELADSELSWLLWAQVSLTKEKHFQTWQKQLNLFHDKQGLLRCGGRLGNAPVSYATKYPILLPRDHYLTTLIVKDAHERVRHNGVTETLNEIRKRYWIVKGRSLVKIHIHRCVLCRRFEGPAYQGPPPPPLPEFKLKEQPPFSYTGVDFAGPIHVRTFGHAKSDKVWICLFTCLVVRAVHLETVTDLSTETFLRCLKRFTARRGFPFTFLSDNGKTFKAAAVFIKTVFQDSTVQDHLSRRGVDWRFNVERAPWWGGVFERLVRSTKRCLRKMVGHSRLSLDELNTALIKVEAVINSRPLTYVSSSNLQEPLTPSHFLTRSRVLNLPDYLGYSFDPTDEDFTLTTTTTSQLRERLGRLNNALDHFWARWREEYLAELRECHRYVKNDSTHRPVIAVGDIVIVHDEKLPRGHWKLGKVEEVICGHDGKIRAATVRLPTGNSILRRPVQLLYPLEVSDTSPNDISGAPVNIDVDDRQADNPSNHEVPSENLQSGQSLARVNDTGSAEADTVDGSNKRPRRTAALKAKKVLKALSLQDKTDSEG